MKLEIIYQDEHFVAVNKPAHVLSIPDRFDPMRPNLRSILKKKFGSAYAVHRLDHETTGVIIYALHEEMHAQLNTLFEQRATKKEYLALTLSPSQDAGHIDEPIREHTGIKGYYIVHAKGKPSQTSYEVEERFGPYALVRLHLHTGRTHQIRVHMKHIGAPLMVDNKYGAAESFMLSQIKRVNLGKYEEEKPLLSRSSLHASNISFEHPITHQMIDLAADLPKDMRAVINQLKKVYK